MNETLDHRGQTLADRVRHCMQAAETLLAAAPTRLEFWREIFGPEGLLAQHFPTPEARRRLEETPEHAQLLAMMGGLRTAADPAAPQRVITVRLPADLHESLKREAAGRQRSMNKLCLEKLLQPLAS